MPRTAFTLFIKSLLLLAALARPAAAQEACSAPLTLVLSGGGAKGLAHIGVLRVLDSLGIRPTRIVGTSMGSIVGGMYASGYTGREIDSLARSLSLSDLFTQYAPRTPRALAPRLPLAVWEEGEGGFSFQRAAVRDGEVNALLDLAMLRGNLRARGHFDSLPVPFRAVATDLGTRTPVVLDSGDLARAVRASMAIPLVFDPERINDRFLGDGALVANIPVSAARALGTDPVLISDATEHLPDTGDFANPLVMAEQLLGFLFYQPAAELRPGDLLLRPAVDSFKSLDFDRRSVDRLIELGYEEARTRLAGWHCPPAPRVAAPRTEFRVATVRGESPSTTEERFVRALLGLEAGKPLDVERVRNGFRYLRTSDGIRAVWLQPSGPPDSLTMDLLVRPASRRLAAFGVAYDNDLGGRMWLGAVDRKLLGQRLEASVAMGLGELRQDLELGLRTYTVVARPLRPALTVGASNEDIRRFDRDGDELAHLTMRDLNGFAGLEQELGRTWQVALGGRARVWGNDHFTAEALGGLLTLTTLDRERPLRAEGELEVMQDYTMVHGSLGYRIPLSARVAVTPWARYGWGSDSLPPHLTFVLGGFDGFPGERIGERRGNREAYAGLTATIRAFGPVALRAQGAIGQTALGGPAFPRRRWELGGRVGLGLDTPVGPIRLEYGLARGGRKEFFVRLGEWF